MNLTTGLMDLHNHTVWSDGVNSPREIIENAIKHKVKAVGISDHFRTGKCHSIQPEEFMAYINAVTKLKQEYAGVIEVYCGIEFTIMHFESFKRIPYTVTNQLDYFLLEYLDNLYYQKPDFDLNEIAGYLRKAQCRVGLAHTNLLSIANYHRDSGGLEAVLDVLKFSNIIWEINSHSDYEWFNGIVNNSRNTAEERLIDGITARKIDVSVGSDTHALEKYEFERLKQANLIAYQLNTQGW